MKVLRKFFLCSLMLVFMSLALAGMLISVTELFYGERLFLFIPVFLVWPLCLGSIGVFFVAAMIYVKIRS